jgi:hypothetical protein
MKKVFMLFALIILGLSAFAQNKEYRDVVYLKNGSVVKGVIMEQIPNQSLKIATADGSTFVFQMTEVEKIAKEEVVNQQQPSKDMNNNDKTDNNSGSRFEDLTKRHATFYSLFTFNIITQNIKANKQAFEDENGVKSDKMSMAMRANHSSYGTAVLGYNFGIVYRTGLGFETGLMFEFFHDAPNFSTIRYSGNYSYENNYDITMNQIGISMPINVNYNFQINKKFSVFASSGFLLNIGLWYKYERTFTTYEYYNNNLRNTSTDYVDADYYSENTDTGYPLNRVNLFYTMGIGVKFSRFRLKMEKDWGLTNVMSYAHNLSYNDPDIHCKLNRPFTLSLQMMF